MAVRGDPVDDVLSRVREPADGDELAITVGWLRFHRDALAATCAGMAAEQLTVDGARGE